MRTNGKKVLVALSGGIDSAVSAHLLIKQGYHVEAAFMKNWSSTAGLLRNECPWLADRQDALRVAAFLRIPMHTLDFEKQYAKKIMHYFFKEYAAGRTPNPDVMCNKEIKFGLLYDWAMRHEFDYLATGHYAQNIAVEAFRNCEKFQLIRSLDEFKDQTYFIYNIKPEQLPHLLFPIGGMKKTAVRALAKKLKLPNADKKESMGLCFVGKIRLKDFLEQKLKPKAGPIVLIPSSVSLRGRVQPRTKQSRRLSVNSDVIAPSFASTFAKATAGRSAALAMTDEKVIGQHQGLYNYTIGQRQGIHIGPGGPYYVVRKNLKTNTLYVTNDPNDPALETKEVEIHSVNWIGDMAGGMNCEVGVKNYDRLKPRHGIIIHNSKFIIRAVARYRHQGALVPVTVVPTGKGRYQATFKTPQKAIASGQSLVLYRGKECLGGGVIV